MVNLRAAMDASFWDLELASPHNLDGSAKSIPGDPFPLPGSRASRALRVQQLSFLGNGFPLGLIPSISPAPSRKDLGPFSLQSLILRPTFGDWWLGVVGQCRPKKLISDIKAELSAGKEFELQSIKNAAKHVLDKSLYSLGVFTHIPITSSSSILLTSEAHGDRKKRRNKLMLYNKLPNHDLTLDAAWPELFVDNKGKYWNVPESISLDLLSNISESGLRYRFGLHKNAGQPQAFINSLDNDVPVALLPGLCAKVACSYEKHKDLWRQKETKEDLVMTTEEGDFFRPAYDRQLKEPHASISAIIGGACGAWFRGTEKTSQLTSGEDGDGISSNSGKRAPIFADLFGSTCCSFQHGKFRKPYGDLTRVDSRLDLCSAYGLAKHISNMFNGSSSIGQQTQSKPASLPRLSFVFQQQIAGPIVFRIDSKHVVDAPGKKALQVEDVIYSLSYSLRLLDSGKVVAWYSPKRKEGMIELKMFEF